MKYYISAEDCRLNVYTDLALDGIKSEIEAETPLKAIIRFRHNVMNYIEEYRVCDDFKNCPENYLYNMSILAELIDACTVKDRNAICELREMHTITINNDCINIHLFK